MENSRQVLKAAAIATGLAAGLAAMLVWAADEAETAATATPAATTIYMGGHLGGSTADKLNELHAKMAQDGWRYADMEVHYENADTEGVWITYTKP